MTTPFKQLTWITIVSSICTILHEIAQFAAFRMTLILDTMNPAKQGESAFAYGWNVVSGVALCLKMTISASILVILAYIYLSVYKSLTRFRETSFLWTKVHKNQDRIL